MLTIAFLAACSAEPPDVTESEVAEGARERRSIEVADRFRAGADQAVDVVVYADATEFTDAARADLVDPLLHALSTLTFADVDWRLLVVNDASGCAPNGIMTWKTPFLGDALHTALTRAPGEAGRTGEVMANVAEAVAQGNFGCSEGLLRPQVPLHVLVVSDRADQSADSWDAYLDDVLNDRLDRVQVSAIVSDDSWAAVVDETGGVRIDLDADWTEGLDAFAQQAGSQSRFELTRPADPGSVELFVDGVRRVDFMIDVRMDVIYVLGEAASPGTDVRVAYRLED